jgi:hypothetical protein
VRRAPTAAISVSPRMDATLRYKRLLAQLLFRPFERAQLGDFDRTWRLDTYRTHLAGGAKSPRQACPYYVRHAPCAVLGCGPALQSIAILCHVKICSAAFNWRFTRSATAQVVAAALARHFDPSQSQIASFDPDMALQSLALDLMPHELIKLPGAPIGSIVTMQEVSCRRTSRPIRSTSEVPGGLMLTVRDSNYINGRNQIVLFNKGLAADPKSIHVKLIQSHPRAQKSHIPGGSSDLSIVEHGTILCEDEFIHTSVKFTNCP